MTVVARAQNDQVVGDVEVASLSRIFTYARYTQSIDTGRHHNAGQAGICICGDDGLPQRAVVITTAIVRIFRLRHGKCDLKTALFDEIPGV